jgi:CubicO group peptidase (beta-lactamase class C family)
LPERGAPADLNSSEIWAQLLSFGGTPRSGRRLLLRTLAALAPNSPPGTRYEYSNAGYALAGHTLETVADRAWEDLLTERLFVPLGMTSGGCGVPATPRHLNQPWGHQSVNNQPAPVEPGPDADNPSAIGPAATVHCTAIDLAKFAAFHVAGHRADTPWLSRNSFIKPHTALADNASYALGWLQIDRPWDRARP